MPLEQRTVTRSDETSISAAVRDGRLPQSDKDAFAAYLFDNAKRPEAFEGKTVREVIEAQRAHEVGVRLERQDRESTRARRAAMARVIVLAVRGIRDTANGVVLDVDVTNRSAKAMTGFDAGLEVHDGRTHRRIGLAELHVERRVAPHSRAGFAYPMRYVRFGEDTAGMRLAQGRPKSATLDPAGVRFADGPAADTD